MLDRVRDVAGKSSLERAAGVAIPEVVSTARFDVYGRYELDIERRNRRWIVYERGEGKRRARPDLAIPPDVPEDELGAYLDDLLHEAGSPGLVIRRIR